MCYLDSHVFSGGFNLRKPKASKDFFPALLSCKFTLIITASRGCESKTFAKGHKVKCIRNEFCSTWVQSALLSGVQPLQYEDCMFFIFQLYSEQALIIYKWQCHHCHRGIFTSHCRYSSANAALTALIVLLQNIWRKAVTTAHYWSVWLLLLDNIAGKKGQSDVVKQLVLPDQQSSTSKYSV